MWFVSFVLQKYIVYVTFPNICRYFFTFIFWKCAKTAFWRVLVPPNAVSVGASAPKRCFGGKYIDGTAFRRTRTQ